MPRPVSWKKLDSGAIRFTMDDGSTLVSAGAVAERYRRDLPEAEQEAPARRDEDFWSKVMGDDA